MTTQQATDPKVIHGREAAVYVANAANVDPTDETKNLKDLVTDASGSTEFSARITDLTVTDPEASVEIQNTFGGQIKTESPFELVTADFTMRFKDLEMFEELHGSADTLSGATSFARISGSSGTPGGKTEKSILFNMEKTVNNTDYILNYLLHNSMFQQMGEISLSGDGTAELTGSAVCLIQDRYVEKNF